MTMSAAELKKLFTEKVTLVAESSSTSWLNVKLNGRGLGDEQLASLGRFLDELLSGSTAESWAHIELAENMIGSAGLTAVLDVLGRHSVCCKNVKLYKNKLDDVGGLKLAEHVQSQRSACEEIHLSHNGLTARTLVALCMAVSKHEAYPVFGRSKIYIPCWIRMEYNLIAQPLQVIESLRRDGPVSICTAENRDVCGPWRCACASKVPTDVPKVHLFSIAAQTRPRATPQDETEYRKEIVRWGGKQVAPSARSPTAAGGASGGGPVLPPAAVASGGTPGGATPVAAGGSSRGNAWGGNSGRAWDVMAAGVQQSQADARASRGYAAANPCIAPGIAATVGARQAAAVAAAGGRSPQAAASPQSDAPWGSTHVGDVTSSTTAVTDTPFAPSPESARKGDNGNDDSCVIIGNRASDKLADTSSFVTDKQGRRRILPEQLPESASAQFICQLCGFVLVKPVMTTCAHLFCASCFTEWKEEQVAKKKKAGETVPTLPCPQQGCPVQLRKQDISSLDAAAPAKAGQAQLYQRMRNNLRVRCVHHSDHFKFPFGKDAEKVKRDIGVCCTWSGDLNAYDDHLCKQCPVELSLRNEKIKGSNTGAGKGVSAQTSDVDDTDTAIPDGGELRVAKYDYHPKETDTTHISLKAKDLLLTFEITDAGWAAGIRLNPETKEEMGEAGWFPSAYLYPAGYVDTGN